MIGNPRFDRLIPLAKSALVSGDHAAFRAAINTDDVIDLLAETERLAIRCRRLSDALDAYECGERPRPKSEVALSDARAEIARLDALSRATADDPEDVVPCVPCGKVECACGVGEDEEMNA